MEQIQCYIHTCTDFFVEMERIVKHLDIHLQNVNLNQWITISSAVGTYIMKQKTIN
jgi:hypothetical protein